MLKRKIGRIIEGQDLLRMTGGSSVTDAAKRMAERHVGAILVCQGQAVCGIFTERDMLERVVAAGLAPDAVSLTEVMTPDPASIDAEDSVLAAVVSMKKNRSRHLTVTRNGEIAGIVSVRDLLRSVVEENAENRQVLDGLWEGFPV